MKDFYCKCAECSFVHKKSERKRKIIIGIGNGTDDTFNCPQCGSGIIVDLVSLRDKEVKPLTKKRY